MYSIYHNHTEIVKFLEVVGSLVSIKCGIVFQDSYGDDSTHIEATIDCVQTLELSKIEINWEVKEKHYADTTLWDVKTGFFVFTSF